MSSKLVNMLETSNSQMVETDMATLSGVVNFIIARISWLLGFIETLGSLISITFIHRNFECHWQLTNSFLHVRPWILDQVVAVTTLRTAIEEAAFIEEQTKLDDYLPCRQISIDHDHATGFVISSSKLSDQAEFLARGLLST